MNVPMSLLRQLVDVPADPAALAERMNGRIAEVEHVVTFGARSSRDHVAVGLFERCLAQTDSVQLWQVRTSQGQLELAVQAKHAFQPGDRHAVVAVGGRTPDGQTVTSRDLGPYTSQGMVLSDASLGVGDDTTRPFAFAPDVSLDAHVHDALELDDAVLVFDLEPNRPDLFSLMGMARDLSAIYDTPLKPPATVPTDFEPMPEDTLRIRVDATDRVHRYAALELSGVRVGPSPQWLQNAVRKLGMRPINNVVDAANLAMMELGQPLHTFDRHTLTTGVIGLRMAAPGEAITTLDGVTRTLTDECLLVTDGPRPIALAGVMGDLDSEITTASQDLLIESATFDMASVRRCSRRLALRTEASLRFEKGQPTCNVVPAMARLAHILTRIGGDSVRVGRIADARVRAPQIKTLAFSPSEARTRMALQVDDDTLRRRFTALGIQVTADGQVWQLVLPEHRPDLVIQEDLNEELGRLHGYEHVASTVPVAPLIGPPPNPLFVKAFAIRHALVGAGLDEVCLGAWFGDEDLAVYGLAEDRAVSLRNPVASNLVHFRTTALPDLVKAVVLNRKSLDRVGIFEVGRVFTRVGTTITERAHVAGAVAGADRSAGPARFYEARDALHKAITAVGARTDWVPVPSDLPWVLAHCFHPGRFVGAAVDGQLVGVAGELHPALVAATELVEPPATFHLDLEALLERQEAVKRFAPPPRFPSVTYHVNVVAPERLWGRALLDAVDAAGLDWLCRSAVRDVYSGPGVDDGHKRVTVELEFNHPQRSLTHDEVLPQVQTLKTVLGDQALVVEV